MPRHHLPRGVLIGGMAITSYGLALYALSLGTMAPVAALRETSSIFAVLIGTFLMRESLGRLRLLASALVVESHEVIDIQSGSADGLKSFYPGMRSVPIVVV